MALREILAKLGVEVDTGSLAKGAAGVEGLAGGLAGLPGAAGAADSAVQDLVGTSGTLLGALSNAKAAVQGLGVALALNVFKDFVFGLAEQADALRDESIQLGLSVEELQAWQHAAGLSGVEAGQLANAINFLNKNVAKAAEGTGPAAKAFKSLGVELKDSEGNLRRPIDLVEEIAAGLMKIENPAKRTEAAMAVFGRGGAKLLPFLQEGPEGIRKLREEVTKLGGGFTNEFADASDELNDDLARLDLSLLSIKATLVEAVLPAFVRGVAIFRDFVALVRNAADRSHALQTVLALAAVRGIGLITTYMARFGGLLAIVTRFALRIALPFLAIEDLITFLSGGDSLVGRALDRAFGEGTAQKIQDWIQGIKDSFVDLWTDLRDDPEEVFAEWRRSNNEYSEFWKGWNDGLATESEFLWSVLTGGWENAFDMIEIAGDGIELAMRIIWLEIKNAGLQTAAALADGFADIWNDIVGGAMNAFSMLKKGLEFLPGTSDITESIGAFVKDLSKNKVANDAQETIERQTKRERRQIASDSDALSGRFDRALERQRAGPGALKVEVNVDARGAKDPQAVAEKTGAATGRGVRQGLKGARAALVQGAGGKE